MCKSVLDNRPALYAAVWQVAETAGYLWEKGWAERNGGNITVNITEHVDDEMRAMPAISEPKAIGTVLPPSLPYKENTFSYSELLNLQETKFPFGLIYETKSTEYEADAEFTLLHALDTYIIEFYRTFSETNILEYKMTVKASDSRYKIPSDMSCIDFMGTKSKILVEE